jgi:hypothetical protein
MKFRNGRFNSELFKNSLKYFNEKISKTELKNVLNKDQIDLRTRYNLPPIQIGILIQCKILNFD